MPPRARHCWRRGHCAKPASPARPKRRSAQQAAPAVIQSGDAREAPPSTMTSGSTMLTTPPARAPGGHERRLNSPAHWRRRRPRARRSLRPSTPRRRVRRIRGTAPRRTKKSRCSRRGRKSNGVPDIRRAHQRQWIMTPFAGNPVAPGNQHAAHDKPAPTPVPSMTPNTTPRRRRRRPPPPPTARSNWRRSRSAPACRAPRLCRGRMSGR